MLQSAELALDAGAATLRLCVRPHIGQRLEPFDPRDAVARLAAASANPRRRSRARTSLSIGRRKVQAVFLATVVGACVLLFLLGFVAPRLSWWPQKGVAKSMTKGAEWAGQAPGRAGRWFAKPFQKSRKAASRSTEAGREGRGKVPFQGSVPSAFQARGLAKRYGSVEALAGVDLEVHEGELVGLIGPNGAGKSTLVKIACGLVRPSAGSADICGAPAGTPQARASLGYLAELFRFPGWHTADEVLALHQRLARSTGGEDERRELLALVGLTEARRRKVDAMSKGMQQRLGIAQALVGRPPLLLLDEPTSALDPAGRRTVRGLLEELRRRGVSVLLNSHLLSEVELVCDRVVILARGRVVAAGRPEELARARGVEIDTDAGVQRFPDAGREDAPRLVADLVARGERVYGVRVLSTTLEETYLSAVGEDAS
jgi:ABC-2 type transport system ATP-binding protein